MEIECYPGGDDARRNRERDSKLATDQLSRVLNVRIDDICLPQICRRIPRSDPGFVEFLLDLAGTMSDPLMKELLVRMIACSKASYEAQPLLDLYDRTPYQGFRWAVANTIWCSKPIGITEWLPRVLMAPEPSRSKQMLVYAAAKHLKPDIARPIAEHVMEEWPGHAAKALGKVGDSHSLELLKRKLETPGLGHRWVYKEIQAAIDKIENRLLKQLLAR